MLVFAKEQVFWRHSFKSIKPDNNLTSIPSIRQSGKILFQVLQYITTKSCLGAKEDEGDDEDMEGNQENGEKSKRPEMESETPWVSLASLALFKLFNDWQAQGPITTIFKVLLKRFKTRKYPGLPAPARDIPRRPLLSQCKPACHVGKGTTASSGARWILLIIIITATIVIITILRWSRMGENSGKSTASSSNGQTEKTCRAET